MRSKASHGRHRRAAEPRHRIGTALLLAAVTTGASAALAWSTIRPPPSDAAAAPAPAAAVTPAIPASAQPARIVIPAIGVSTDLEALHRRDDGALTTPVDFNKAGWFAEGVVPGDRGPAVIAGHLDSAAAGAAVFYRLADLQPGDDVFIEATDGTARRFVVDTAQRFEKAAFPTELVYGPTALAELRLITCTGSFDHAARSYLDNLVVTAFAAP